MPAARLLKSLDGYLRGRSALYNRRLRPIAVDLALSLKLTGREWAARADDAVAAPDNRFIPRVADAGAVRDGYQVMHNGLLIRAEGYYGAPLRHLLKRNRGVHEPQEERAFAAVLAHVRPGSVMIELGAYWAYYSMWFLKEVGRGTCYLVEPDPANLEVGRGNFARNGMEGTFLRAFVGAASGADAEGNRTVCVDDLVRDHGIDRIAILHGDIQGAEAEMLAGAARTLDAGKVDYLFISTHTNELHGRCRRELEARGWTILAAADLDETYSHDGLIVARAPHVAEPAPIPIALKPKRKAEVAP